MRNVDAAGLGIGDDYPPRLMGVLNVSEESPYEPSVFDDPGEAAAYVDEELIDEGADIVDVGLESANKRFGVLSAEEELDRLDTAVAAMESVSGDAVFSIETRYHEVAEAALDAGFDMVNDICGFADAEMPRLCAERDVAVVKMASPPDLTRPGAVEEVDDIYAALERDGLTEKTIVDPAFGGWSEEKTLAHDRETFDRLREFRALDRPVLVSINRKNFLRDIAGRSTEAALPVSLAATSMAVERGAHVIRTHDVAETRDAALVGDALARDRLRTTAGGVTVEELDATTVREVERHLDRLDDEGEDTRSADNRAAARRGTTRVFELGGLSPAERELLADATRGTDATVAGGGDRRLLIGTPAALDAVVGAASGEFESLDAALTAVARVVD